MIFYAGTHVGNIRRTNEDCFYIPQDESGFFALVADGMGGHSAGEVASLHFVETVKKALLRARPQKITPKVVKKIFSMANKNIFQEAQASAQRRGMGTTATLAVFNDSHVLIGHVGDSRAYLFSRGALSQITRDHSYVQSLVDSGLISREAAAVHPRRNIITRAIGTDIEVETDIFTAAFGAGDILLLCTDGLSGLVSDAQIAAILGGGVSLAADRLIEAALAGGGHDNISVVLAARDGGAA